MPNILRLPDLIAQTGLSRSTIYRYIADGIFPRPVSLGPRAVGWLETDVAEWIDDRVQARGRENTNSVKGAS